MSKELNLAGNESGVVSSKAVKKAMSAVLDGEDKDYACISVLLVSDDEIKEVNKKYLGHDYATDVLTFPLHIDSDPIEGEIYVSLQTTERNSKVFNNSHSSEIIRVVIHGLLHLTGYDDSTSKSREKMKKKEDQYLNLIADSVIMKHQ